MTKQTDHSRSVCFLGCFSALRTRLDCQTDLKFEEAKVMADKYGKVDYRTTNEEKRLESLT